MKADVDEFKAEVLELVSCRKVLASDVIFIDLLGSDSTLKHFILVWLCFVSIMNALLGKNLLSLLDTVILFKC